MGKKRLTVREKKFVKALVLTNNQTQAAIDAGYSTPNRDVAAQVGAKLMARAHVQNALDAELEKTFPELEKRASEVLHELLTSDEVRHETKLKTIEVLARIKGWLAPTKHASLKASFKLPEE